MRSHDGCDGTQFFSISSFTAQKKKKRGQAVEPKDYQRDTLPPLLKKTGRKKTLARFFLLFWLKKKELHLIQLRGGSGIVIEFWMQPWTVDDKLTGDILFQFKTLNKLVFWRFLATPNSHLCRRNSYSAEPCTHQTSRSSGCHM